MGMKVQLIPIIPRGFSSSLYVRPSLCPDATCWYVPFFWLEFDGRLTAARDLCQQTQISSFTMGSIARSLGAFLSTQVERNVPWSLSLCMHINRIAYAAAVPWLNSNIVHNTNNKTQAPWWPRTKEQTLSCYHSVLVLKVSFIHRA